MYPPCHSANLLLFETPRLAVLMAFNEVPEDSSTWTCLRQLWGADSEEGTWLSFPHLAEAGREGIISVKNQNGSSWHSLCISKHNVCLGGNTKTNGCVSWSCGGTSRYCNALLAEWGQRQALAHSQRLWLHMKCRKDMNRILPHSSKASRVGTINTSPTAPGDAGHCDLLDLPDDTRAATSQRCSNKQYSVSVWSVGMFQNGFHIEMNFS